MKAYVIKNKEGKYKTNAIDSYGYSSFYVNELWQGDLFDNYELALIYCLEDEQPVKITIAEGDLEEEIKKLKEDLEIALKGFSNEQYEHEHTIDTSREIQENLSKQIKTESDARKRFVKENQILKKALEFAWYNSDEFVSLEDVIEQAKESIKNEL